MTEVTRLRQENARLMGENQDLRTQVENTRRDNNWLRRISRETQAERDRLKAAINEALAASHDGIKLYPTIIANMQIVLELALLEEESCRHSNG